LHTFPTRDEAVVVFGSAARTALLSEQMCILIRFLARRSSVRLRIAITSAENTMERLPIGMLLLHLYKGPLKPAP
jgi:hypothetical protein